MVTITLYAKQCARFLSRTFWVQIPSVITSGVVRGQLLAFLNSGSL